MMKRTLVAVGAIALLAGCSSSDASGADETVAKKPDCVSADLDSNYAGFSKAQVAEFTKQRQQMLPDASDDAQAWQDGARQFATYFLDQIALKPDSLCANDYKTIQSLNSAEMDFESRTDKPLDPDQTKEYIRTLYQTAGLSKDRGDKRLDSRVDETFQSIKQTRSGWGS
ncbi:membrane lipoprotein lipid attachment site-containing protein [Stakelama marina]|uniref:Membrane lipoprotein lipid attachment site-containing protein n=1 Tax=Stakelama marina TaxID=2826939 RepID=A0A8T4IAX3_9SPHN|nr:membrane lipoprotein lipid attachment site-containing protein [Stakelama marina]MBR0551531.1 membrane lipoprotein lipid attachment site-containing protein [Stakelama marina]